MGWNLCIATEGDRKRAIALNQQSELTNSDNFAALEERIVSLSRHFTYELLHDGGQLWKYLTPEEVNLLTPDYIGEPVRWQPRDPEQLLITVCKVQELLREENGQLPLNHFLWFVDNDNKRQNGSTEITLPFGGIELKVPHDPIVKLDGGHHDPEHRHELRRYKMHIDLELLAQFNCEMK